MFPDIKKEFPVFESNPDLVYLDSAATSLKPRRVIEKMIEYYYKYPANIHRGLYQMAQRATAEYEETREEIAKFIGADWGSEIIFTKGTTESLNLLAYSLSLFLKKEDNIVASVAEHHSNYVPWQMLAKKVGCEFRLIDIDEKGQLLLEEGVPQRIDNILIGPLEKIIDKNTKILSLAYVSNVTGIINPIKEIVSKAKRISSDVLVVVDGAQAVGHIKVEVKSLGCDFFAFSGHKMFGPNGVGVLWGKKSILENMPAFQYGGDMIQEVGFSDSYFRHAPYKFEAGTPPIPEVIGLKEAVRFLKNFEIELLHKHEEHLLAYLLSELNAKFGENIALLGSSDQQGRIGLISFNINGVHPHDVAEVLASRNIAIRAGHHCTMPLHYKMGLSASCRVSMHMYNSFQDLRKLIQALHYAGEVLSGS